MGNFRFNRILCFCSLLSIFLILNACGKEDPVVEEMEQGMEPCDNVSLTGNTLDLNGSTYNISEYSYSDAIVLNHSFRFKVFDDTCMDSIDIALDFSHSISFPDFSLAGEYSSKFTTNVLELDLEEMTGTFRPSGAGTQYIVSGGTATISEPSETSYLIEVDATTSSLTGSTTDVMQLSVTVDR